MKIKALQVQDFRNQKDSFLVFDHVNFIVGKNNEGKSSLKGALEYALVGQNEWSNGRSNKALIRQGQNSAVVEAEVEGLGCVFRSITSGGNKVRLNGHLIPDRELENEYQDAFGFGYEPLTASLNSYKFLEMTPNEQKDFLFRLANVKLDGAGILAYMDRPSPKCQEIVLQALKGKAISFELLDEVYKQFFNTRRLKKKELAASQAKLAALTPPSFNASLDMAAVQQKIKDLTAEQQATIKRIAAIEAQKGFKMRTEAAKKKLMNNIAELEAKLLPQISLDKAEDEILSNVTQLHDIELLLEQAKTTVSVLNTQAIPSLQKVISGLNRPVCPLSDKLVCNTDKSGLLHELQEKVQLHQKEVLEQQRKIEKYSKQVKDLRERNELLQNQLTIADKLDGLREQLQAVEKELQALIVDDDVALKMTLALIEKELSELKENEGRYLEWKNTLAQIEASQKEVEKLLDEVEMYEYLVGEFAPKGIKTRILKQIITPLEKHCKQVLQQLTGGVYELRFDFSKDFQILVKTNSGEVSLTMLSRSERLRLGVVFQDAVNNLTGTRILMMDDVEILDDENLEYLLKLLDILKDNYDTIIVVMTQDKTTAQAVKHILPAKIFYLENNSITEM